ncbi:rhodanese-like domain-containing protein, partial [Bacteroidota bacterium]
MNIFNKKILTVLSVLIAAIFINSCLEEVIPPTFTAELNKTAEMLIYFEGQGDFPNSAFAPALIEAQEVFYNINNYLIIDLRPNGEYVAGHIENSINVISDSLYQYVSEIQGSNYGKIVLVSKNGQSSAYFTCLLRLAGYNNIYTLNYGMASWNNDFAEDWFDAIGNDPEILIYNNDSYPMNDFTSLPRQLPGKENQTLKDYIHDKINNIVADGFADGLVFRRRLVIYPSDYPICFGSTARLYFARRVGEFAERGHAEGVKFYRADPAYDFRSINNLQTLPTDRTIFIYGATGQLSACIVAYLRVLGYDAVTLLFGANQLIYGRMIDDPEINSLAFTSSNIM